jgi:hypothetical protein
MGLEVGPEFADEYSRLLAQRRNVAQLMAKVEDRLLLGQLLQALLAVRYLKIEPLQFEQRCCLIHALSSTVSTSPA